MSIEQNQITHRNPRNLAQMIRNSRLRRDDAAEEQIRLKAMFGQARRRAREKPVTLPKLAWMDKD